MGLWLRDEAAAPGMPSLTQFTWTLPERLVLDSPPVVSPDGRRIAFVGRDAAGNQLYVHELDSLGAQVVAAGAARPG